MGLALASAEAAVRAWRHGGGDTAPTFQQAFAARMRGPFALEEAPFLETIYDRGGVAIRRVVP